MKNSQNIFRDLLANSCKYWHLITELLCLWPRIDNNNSATA